VGKTKLFGVLLGLVTALNALGLLHFSPEQLKAIQALLGSGVVWGFRDAIAKGSNFQ
jgi:hypothetical protein